MIVEFYKKIDSNLIRILSMADWNRHSDNYGCFDKNFWHYKVIDYPSGMFEEFILPISIAYTTNYPGNDLYNNKKIKSLIKGAIEFSLRKSHKNGSNDDYFLYEQAHGSTAFSLFALIYSYHLVGLKDERIKNFFKKRINFLLSKNESGSLSNHIALKLLCLTVYKKFIDNSYSEYNENKIIEKLIKLQCDEGWHLEYNGYDPGYQTLTLAFMAITNHINPNKKLKNSMEKSINVLNSSINPDGSVGGFYSSRKTFNFYVIGFLLSSEWSLTAKNISNIFFKSFISKNLYFTDDDRMIGHNTWDYLFSLYFGLLEEKNFHKNISININDKFLPIAGLLIKKKFDWHIYLSLKYNGRFSLYFKNKLLFLDNGISLILSNKIKLISSKESYKYKINDDKFLIYGNVQKYEKKEMTPFKLIFLRILMSTIGRFIPNLIRKILQFLLINNSLNKKYFYEREIKFINKRLHISDKIYFRGNQKVESLTFLNNNNQIYTATSNFINKSFLLIDDCIFSIKIKKKKNYFLVERFTKDSAIS